MRSQRTQLIVEIALTAALAAVLSMFAVKLPINFAGGTISLSMVPIFVLALRRGAIAGVLAGVLFGMADMLIEPFFIMPQQVFLDYIVAFAAVGLAGLGSAAYNKALDRSQWLALLVAVPFMVLGGAGRFAAAWTSGVLFFGANAPAGQPVWLYSIVYNLSYIVPSTIVCITAALLVLPVLERAVPVRDGSAVTVG